MSKFKVPKPGYTPAPAPAPVEGFLSDLCDAVQTRYKACIVHSRPAFRHNLTPAEREGMQALRQQHDMIVKPADKNLGLCVMRVEDYREAVRAHVLDTAVYSPVAAIEEAKSRACTQLRGLVGRFEGLLPAKHVSEFLLQGCTMQEVPHLYIMPKLHKMKQIGPPIIGRPIAACHSWITTNMSIFMADLLNSKLGMFDTILQDRTELVAALEQTTVSADTWLLTFDVESLYPSIDQRECAAACAQLFAERGSRFMSMVEECLFFVMQNNIVQVEGKYYRQISGGAMGTNCLPQAAQLYLAVRFEEALKRKLGARFPSFYKRYIDDGFVLFKGSEQELLAFVNALNSELSNIRITHKYSRFEVEFLDVVIYKSGPPGFSTQSLKVRTHQKALNKYLYIPYSSFHHPGMFKSFMNAELIRYVVTNSDVWWFDCMVSKFTSRLLQRGYPTHVISAAVSKVSYANRSKYLQHSTITKAKSSVSALVVPYAFGVPEMHLQQLLHSTYMKHPDVHGTVPKPLVCFKKNRNLGSWLVRAGA
jgi:hypothetical protein